MPRTLVTRMLASGGMLAVVLGLVLAAPSTRSAVAAGASVAIDSPGSNGCIPNTGGQGSGYCFTPNSVTVSPGSAVTWTNRSVAPHTVTRCTVSACSGVGGGSGTAPAGFDSGTINPGGQASISFGGAGSYVYYCAIHTYAAMHGTVTVSGPPPTPAAAPPPTARPPASAPPSNPAARGPSSPSPAHAAATTSTSATATSTGSAPGSQPLAQASATPDSAGSSSSAAPVIAATTASTGGGAPIGLIIALVLLAAGGIGAGVTAWRRRAGNRAG
jgi:plastocyanin